MAPKRKARDPANGQTLAKAPRKKTKFEAILKFNPHTLTIIHNETKQEWVLSLDQKETEVSFQDKNGQDQFDIGLQLRPDQVVEAKTNEKLAALFKHPVEDASDEELLLDFGQLRKAALNGGISAAASELSRQYEHGKDWLDDHIVEVTLQWTKRKMVEPLISEHLPNGTIGPCSIILAYDSKSLHLTCSRLSFT